MAKFPPLEERAERELAAGVADGDLAWTGPAGRALAAVADEASTDVGAGGPVGPLAAATHGTPLAHPGDVGDQFPQLLGLRRDLERDLVVPPSGRCHFI